MRNKCSAAILAAGIFLAMTPAVEAGVQSGIGSWYGPGSGVAMPFCTWTYRQSHDCGWARITSSQTGKTVDAPIIDYCQCYVGTPNERIIDMQWGVVTALGLSLDQGLYPVTVDIINTPVLTDTSMSP